MKHLMVIFALMLTACANMESTQIERNISSKNEKSLDLSQVKIQPQFYTEFENLTNGEIKKEVRKMTKEEVQELLHDGEVSFSTPVYTYGYGDNKLFKTLRIMNHIEHIIPSDLINISNNGQISFNKDSRYLKPLEPVLVLRFNFSDNLFNHKMFKDYYCTSRESEIIKDASWMIAVFDPNDRELLITCNRKITSSRPVESTINKFQTYFEIVKKIPVRTDIDVTRKAYPCEVGIDVNLQEVTDVFNNTKKACLHRDSKDRNCNEISSLFEGKTFALFSRMESQYSESTISSIRVGWENPIGAEIHLYNDSNELLGKIILPQTYRENKVSGYYSVYGQDIKPTASVKGCDY